MTKKDERNDMLTEKFIQLSKDNIESHVQLAQSLELNTKSNQQVAQATKDSSDKLSALMLKVIKKQRAS